MLPYEILTVTEEPQLDARNRDAALIRVEWRTEHDGPFFLRMPKAEFTDTAARALIQAKADELERLRRGY